MTEPSRYDRLDPIARALVDDYDALDLAAMLVATQDQLAALRQVARGYCPACGRGDCAPTADQWYEQRQRADRAEAELRRYTEADSADAAAGSYAGRAERAEQERDTAEAALAQVRSLHRESCPFARGKVGRTAFTCGMCDALDTPAPAATQATDT